MTIVALAAMQFLTEAGYAPEKIEYGINRYINETRRLYSVMESQLEKSTSGFLVGDRLTIADIICVGWANSHGTSPPVSQPTWLLTLPCRLGRRLL